MRRMRLLNPKEDTADDQREKTIRVPGLRWHFVLLQFPMNFVTVRRMSNTATIFAKL